MRSLEKLIRMGDKKHSHELANGVLLGQAGLDRLADPGLLVGRDDVAGILDRLVELAERIRDAEPLSEVLDNEPGELEEHL